MTGKLRFEVNDNQGCFIFPETWFGSLLDEFEELIDAFRRKAEEFKHIIKMGRTQLEDAVPMTLGQTFNGFASILHDEIKNLNFAAEEFLTVNMGATAIGTGITAEPEYAEKCVKARSEERRVGKECRSRWSPYH